MTSLSIPATAPVLSPFDADTSTPPRSPQPHRRRASRNPNAIALPTFNFNPGQDDAVRPDNIDQGSPSTQHMASDGQRRSPRPTLPAFSFNPGADLPPERSPSPTHPVLQEMALNQQRAVRSARPAPLPAFTFAPHTPSVHASPSPTKADFTESQPPLRTGHRRGVSEFVGGGGTDGPQMVSTSPEKPEYRPPPRMHAHKRSQAVSVSDIDTSELIKANALAKARAGSTPTTPSDAQTFSFARSSPQIRQSMSNIVRTPPSSPRRRDSAPGVRPRVGFSEHVDVIPRPLSMISSETEGSNSTIRGCHSLSGSINSIASPTPRPTLVISSSSESTNGSPERPQTADALSTLTGSMASGDKSLSVISLPKRPLSASGSPGTVSSGSPPNKKKYFWLNQNNVSPLATPRAETGNPMDVFVASTPPPKRLEVFGDRARPKTSSGEGASSSRKRKYHTWTSGIFSRKSEKRSSKVKHPPMPTPPVLNRRPSDRLNEIFDADDTIVLREPSPVTTRIRPRTQPLPALQTFNSSPASEPIMSPILDLDAALGPFGSEEKFSQDSHNKQVHASRIAKLHSSERRGTSDAFGSVHRRTESAPTMPAVNRATFGVHRMGSNPSLSEDVFDEEEEDKLLAEENANAMSSGKLVRIHSRPKKLVTSLSEPTSATPTSRSGEGLGLSMDNDDVIIVDTEEEIGRVACARSSDSTIEAPVFSEMASLKRPASSPMTFAYPAPQSQYASSTEGRTTSASMISSPDADHISFDNLSPPSRSHGELSPDFVLRASNDDLPSLSDSISSGALPRFSSSAGTRSSIEHRSASMIVPSTSRSNNQQAWKRASLASLNRLIPGSSHGSKLKFETVPDISVIDDKAKRRSHRISKLLFWRSKDKDEK
ncbi:hypothetical protein LTR84_002332 [Exophiala bonariae]|uniref:Cell wall proline rich protein n=1 Tax=Exophiala bonariae TaxID=1690606 RepID=A0AAV9NC05_9EURO|nr:hypothetical protein LTR84_002332 [Exophiala bonariae]